MHHAARQLDVERAEVEFQHAHDISVVHGAQQFWVESLLKAL